MTNYIVKAGDTLYSIAKQFGTTVSELVKINGIADPNRIVIGQSIATSGEPVTSTTNSTSSKAVIDVFGLQSNTDRTVYATWKWDKDNSKSYQTRWYYDTGDNDIWFMGTDTTVEHKQAVYTAPSNAKRVRLVVKPISYTHKVNNQDTAYWTADWSNEKIYDFKDNPPVAPPTPDVKVDKFKLTATLDNIDELNATHIEFEVLRDNGKLFSSGKCEIITYHASYSCYLTAGSEYKVRCRSVRGKLTSDWSDYSNNFPTIPNTPPGFLICRANSESSIYLEWDPVDTATTYDIQYSTKKEYLDGSDQVNVESGIEYIHYEKTGLEPGEEYFFRLRAVNSNGESSWSGISSVVLGKKPSAPTTWSSTTRAVVGEPLKLYWVHNSEDNSSQTEAELELNINGSTSVITIENNRSEEDKDKTSVYEISTSSYPEGTKLQWRVRTAGITKTFGDWSILRTVDIYAPATLVMTMTDANGSLINTLTSFPFYISGEAGPNTQKPIGYHLAITSNDIYETLDHTGTEKTINKGEQVYSKYFDISGGLYTKISAGDVDLQNNISYSITCMVSMDSGLTAEASRTFTVAWADEVYEPNCEIAIDPETYTASIMPYCKDAVGNLVEDITLSVYRREFDGGFTELISGLDNQMGTFITDPHPPLDYARYRIIATSETTGAVSYYDPPGYPVKGKSIIIQWDEAWTNFDNAEEDEFAEPTWSGSMLKLPGNVDVSDSYHPDVELIEYIGRSRPVSYYGTQLGSTSSWSVEIDKADKDTLYALRRLSRWMGDVYVREPSGSGYWANITVSFSQKHLGVTIPVNIDVTRVEGGV